MKFIKLMLKCQLLMAFYIYFDILTFISMINTTSESLKARKLGAQLLSGRVLDSRPRGHGFEPHRHHCVVVLEQDTFILA